MPLVLFVWFGFGIFVVFDWRRAVIIQKFPVSLGCPFRTPARGSRLLLGLFVCAPQHFQFAAFFSSKSGISKPKARKKPWKLPTGSFHSPKVSTNLPSFLDFFQIFLMFVAYVISTGLSYT